MLTLHPIPAFSDNYIWCIHDGTSAYVVDPGEAKPVESYLKANNLTLKGILVTHHHFDHVSGIDALLAASSDIPVWGPAQESVPGRTQAVASEDTATLTFDDETIDLQVYDVPGHTAGHVAYYASETSLGNLLFCGDTLFSAGCGRLFEGTAEQMHHSLGQLKVLPDNTQVCCTHEYTTANLKFAQAVEPDNPDIQQQIEKVAKLRAQDRPSLPSDIATEKRINPFLRAGEASVMTNLATKCGQHPTSEVDSFAKLRAWKDAF